MNNLFLQTPYIFLIIVLGLLLLFAFISTNSELKPPDENKFKVKITDPRLIKHNPRRIMNKKQKRTGVLIWNSSKWGTYVRSKHGEIGSKSIKNKYV